MRIAIVTVLFAAGTAHAQGDMKVPADQDPAPAPEPTPAAPAEPPTPPPVKAPAPVADAAKSTEVHPDPEKRTKLSLELEVYTQARSTRRAGDDLSELRLDRGELGGRVELGQHAAAELR